MSKIGRAFFGMSFCYSNKKSTREKPAWVNTFVLFFIETSDKD